MQQEIVRHSLTEKDEQTLTGNCSVCGFVAIRKAGNGYQCAVKKAENQRAWRQANPVKSSADRRRRSEHSLFSHDYVRLTATCVVCGPVGLTAWGRGYACATRAAELRAVQEQAPTGWCRECWIIDADRVWLDASGDCPRCEDPARYTLGVIAPERVRRDNSLAAEYAGAGFSVVSVDDDPYAMPEDESVVRGWTRSAGRVLGSNRPWNEV